jgi:chromosome segregation ATPase
VSDISRINKKLSKPLQMNRQLVADLRIKLAIYEKEQVRLLETKDALLLLDEKNKNLGWEYEILLQKFNKIREEVTELKARLEKTIYQVQQKSGFKNLLLEKKLEAMAQDLEKTESALAEVLASTNLQPEIIGDIKHNLEDVLMAKNKQVQQLEDTLADLKQAYAKVIEMYESKLAEHSIPNEELGFTPIRRY